VAQDTFGRQAGGLALEAVVAADEALRVETDEPKASASSSVSLNPSSRACSDGSAKVGVSARCMAGIVSG
jgi:hypothetical protein